MNSELYHNPTVADAIRLTDQVRLQRLAVRNTLEAREPRLTPVAIGHSALQGAMMAGGQTLADETANFVRQMTVGRPVTSYNFAQSVPPATYALAA